MSIRANLLLTTVLVVLLPLSITFATWRGLVRMDAEIELVAEEYEEMRQLEPVDEALQRALLALEHEAGAGPSAPGSGPDARGALKDAETALIAYLAGQYDSEASGEHQADEAAHAQGSLAALSALVGEDWNGVPATERLDRVTAIRASVRDLHGDADEGVLGAQEAADRIERRTLRTVLAVSLASVLACALLATFSNRTVLRKVRELHRNVATRASAGVREEPRDIGAAVSEIDALSERLYLNLEEKSRELLRRERVAGIGLLAADVAHEINNPVNAVLGLSELSLRTTGQGPLDEAARGELHESLTIIRREAVRCKEIVERLMAMVRARGEPETFDAARLLEETVDVARAARPDKARCFHVLRPGQPVPVTAPPQEVRQIMLTLLINAADAIPEQGRIEVDATRSDDEAWLRVRDDGEGFSPEAARDFPIAFRTSRAESGGLGLGLSIAHTLAGDIGAELRASSEGPGCGSLFTLAIPLEEATS